MDAYEYAVGNKDENGNHPPMPKELLDLGYIREFGVKAAYGRDELSYGEIQRMLAAENVYTAYLSRKKYKDKDGLTNWAEWADKNPETAQFLAKVEIMVNEDAN